MVRWSTETWASRNGQRDRKWSTFEKAQEYLSVRLVQTVLRWHQLAEQKRKEESCSKSGLSWESQILSQQPLV